MKSPRLIFGIAFLLLAFSLSACGEVALQHKLSEQDANEILVLLYRHGIEASKVEVKENQDVTWNVAVAPDHAARARELLVENHLPRIPSLGLSGVCKDEGLIPTPKREKCRELLAYKGELINSLERLSGVVDADVVLTVPDVEEFADAGKEALKPTASVVLKSKLGQGGVFSVREEDVQRFVANAVPGLDPRDVAVIITGIVPWSEESIASLPPAIASRIAREGEADEGEVAVVSSASEEQEDLRASEAAPSFSTVLGIQVERESVMRFRIVALIALGVFLFLSCGLVVVVFRQMRSRGSSRGSAASATLMGGGARREALAASDKEVEHLLESPEMSAAAR